MAVPIEEDLWFGCSVKFGNVAPTKSLISININETIKKLSEGGRGIVITKLPTYSAAK